MANSVLITGARAAAALDLARDFAAAGWQVHLADSVKARMARWSALPATHHLYPAPRQEGAAFRECVIRLVEAHDIDLIMPSCEEVFHLAAPALEEIAGARLFAPDIAVLAKLHDKLAFAKAAAEWGLCTPESHAIENAHDVERFAANSRDWVFKPRMSRFGEQTILAPSQQRLRAVSPAGWMAQRYVRGEEACFHAVAHNGTLVACASYSSRWRMRGGASFAFQPLDAARDGQLRAMAETLVRKGNLHGQFGFDVIFDQAGHAYLLECNPRATSGVHLLVGEGQLALAISAGKVLTHTQSASAYLGPAMAVLGLSQAVVSKRLREWSDTARSGHDVIAPKGDRMPMLGALVDAGVFMLRGLRRRISTSAATTYDIEWNGEELP